MRISAWCSNTQKQTTSQSLYGHCCAPPPFMSSSTISNDANLPHYCIYLWSSEALCLAGHLLRPLQHLFSLLPLFRAGNREALRLDYWCLAPTVQSTGGGGFNDGLLMHSPAQGPLYSSLQQHRSRVSKITKSSLLPAGSSEGVAPGGNQCFQW